MRFLITVLLLIFPLSVLATDNSCLLSKYEKYAVEQEIWQKNLTGLITTNNPELKEVAELYLHDQLVLIKKRLLAVTLLLDTSPEKLKTDLKVSRWVQLNIADENELAKNNKAYNQMFKKSKANKNRKAHKYGDKLRGVMRTQIASSKDFKVLYSSFSEKIKGINKIVCSAT